MTNGRKLKVLLAFDSPVSKPAGYGYEDEFKDPDWGTEAAVTRTLSGLGYNVDLIGINDRIDTLLSAVEQNRPDIIFNLVEVYDQRSAMDKNIVALFELLGIPYTGVDTKGLMICNDKGLNKKILTYHKIRVPVFKVIGKGKKSLPKNMKFPMIVKPLTEEASRGIATASVADNISGLEQRLDYIHGSMNTDAIVEEFIEGRELYVPVIGNNRTEVLPLREMRFGSLPEDEPRIATYKAKWDNKYRKKWSIKNTDAYNLNASASEKIVKVCKKAYSILGLKGYARFDIRLTPDNEIYIIEANANPSLAEDDEVALSAQKYGWTYEKLISKIVSLGLTRSTKE